MTKIAIVLTFQGTAFEVSANLPEQIGNIPHMKIKAVMDAAIGILHQQLFQAALKYSCPAGGPAPSPLRSMVPRA
jgi:hypothetical protein